MKSNKKGFTIVELIIVIAILAVLAAVLIPTFANLIKKANDSALEQERTNQKINDAVEKIENAKWLTWEEFESKLAEELAKVQTGATASEVAAEVQKAIDEYNKSHGRDYTGITEEQVKKIVEKALEGSLTTAQVEAIVNQAVSNIKTSTGKELTEAQVKSIVEAAIAKLPTQTGITTEQMKKAIEDAVKDISIEGVTEEQVAAAIAKALEGFETLTEEQIREIIDDLIQVAAVHPVTTLDSLKTALGSDSYIKLTEDIPTSERIEITDSVTINGNNNTIKVDTGDNRVVDISDQTGSITVTFNNIELDGSESAIDSNAYARGISMYGNDDITLNLNNTKVSSPYYAINVAGANKKVEINVDKGSISSGWAALNVWSKTKATFINSTLSGDNDKKAGSSNNFATIVTNQGSAGSEFYFENTTINSSTATTNAQWSVMNKDTSKMTFKNCTFIVSTQPNTNYKWFFYLTAGIDLKCENCRFIYNGVEISDPEVLIEDYFGFGTQAAIDNSSIEINGVTISLSE